MYDFPLYSFLFFFSPQCVGKNLTFHSLAEAQQRQLGANVSLLLQMTVVKTINETVIAQRSL